MNSLREKIKQAVDVASDQQRPQLSVEYACGAQDFWDLDPDGTLRIDIPQADVVVDSYGIKPDIDAALNKVHPKASVTFLGMVEWEQWYAEIRWIPVDYSKFPVGETKPRGAVGYGPTRTAAILAACANALTAAFGEEAGG